MMSRRKLEGVRAGPEFSGFALVMALVHYSTGGLCLK